jgi:hypothetical protein
VRRSAFNFSRPVYAELLLTRESSGYQEYSIEALRCPADALLPRG